METYTIEILEPKVKKILEDLEDLDLIKVQKSGTHKKREAGSAKGKFKLAPDFDAPLEDFKEYM